MEDPTYLETVEQVRNRPDKSILAIKSQEPEKLLAPEVAYPKEVKHLWLYMGFFDLSDPIMLEDRYTDTLCKDIIHFTNLETLTVCDLNLSSELWTTFARNSTCLKKLVFESARNPINDSDLYNFDETDSCRRDALDALFQIPTLESVTITCMFLDYFPKGSSTITSLNLRYIGCCCETGSLFEGFYENCPNLTELYVYDYYNEFRTSIDFKLSIVRLDKLSKLEKLFFNGYIEDERDLEILKALLDLPSLKRVELNCCLGPYKSESPHIMFSASSTSSLASALVHSPKACLTRPKAGVPDCVRNPAPVASRTTGESSDLEYPQFIFCNQFHSSMPSTIKPKDMNEFTEKLNQIKF
jgi:hypothetical protein